MVTQQLRIRLTQDEYERLRKLSDAFGVNSTLLATVLTRAAVQAVEQNKNRVVLPLKFKVEESKN